MSGELILVSGNNSIGQQIDNSDIADVLERAHLYLTTKTTLPLTQALFETKVVYRTEKHLICIDITKEVEDYGRRKRLS